MNYISRAEILNATVHGLIQQEAIVIAGTGFFFEVLLSFVNECLEEIFPEHNVNVSIYSDNVYKLEFMNGGSLFMFDPTVEPLTNKFVTDYRDPNKQGLDLFLLLETPENSLKELYNGSLLPILLIREESRTRVVRV